MFFLELGPGNTLSELTKMTLAATDADLVSPSLPHAKSDTADSMVLLEALVDMGKNLFVYLVFCEN